MKNVISFTGNNVEFKTFLDNAKEAVKDRKNLEFPYYVCNNCEFSAWTVRDDMENHRCSNCGFPVELITTEIDEQNTDKHMYLKTNIEITEEKDVPKTLLFTRYGFKKV